MEYQTIDPNGAFLDKAQVLITLMMSGNKEGSGTLIPWRTGEEDEVGIPLRLVAQAAGRQVEELAEILAGQRALEQAAMFDGRQGARERLEIGAMDDEACINIYALPGLIETAGLELGGGLIQLEARAARELLERLTGTEVTPEKMIQYLSKNSMVVALALAHGAKLVEARRDGNTCWWLFEYSPAWAPRMIEIENGTAPAIELDLLAEKFEEVADAALKIGIDIMDNQQSA